MDKDQIKLFVEENISKNEALDQPIVVRELARFISALQSQENTLGRKPKPEQIAEAWKRWRTEHIEAPAAHNIYVSANKEAIANAALNHIQKIEPFINSDDLLINEANIFAKSYSHRLCHLAKIPATEHIELAWNQWKSGYRFAL